MEHRLTALETRLDTILPTLATKADIEAVRSDIKGWMLATTLTVVGTVLATIIGFMTIVRPSTSAQTVQPIIIQLPAQATAPAPLLAPEPAK